MSRKRSLTGVILTVLLLCIGASFTFTAVQGNHGLFRRVQVQAEVDRLSVELAALEEQTAQMALLTRRLSDSFLDLDLLDEQTRSVLGYVRPDEVVLP
jgi:cell division protein FtsB